MFAQKLRRGIARRQAPPCGNQPCAAPPRGPPGWRHFPQRKSRLHAAAKSL